jgi:hypothetical protein
MTNYGSANVGFLLVDGYDILGVSTKLSDDKEALLELTHGLGDSWEETSPVGVNRYSLTQEGFYDDASGSMNEALVSSVGVARVLTFGHEGNTIGKHFIGSGGVIEAKYKRQITRGELHKAMAEYAANGVVEDQGRINHAHGAETTASGIASSSVDNAASSAAGGSGYLEVSAVTLGGYTNITIKIRHSTDNISFSDLITFTNVTARTAQRATVAGTINRYTHATWLFNGAGSGQSITFMAGLYRN